MSSAPFLTASPTRAVHRVLAAVLVGGALTFDPWGWHTFGPSKWLVLTAGTWLALALGLRDGIDVHRPSLLGWGAFLAWAGFTSVLAVDPLAAWMGTPDRRFGMVALATLAAAFVAGQAVVGVAARRLLARAAVVALLGMGAYGAADLIGIASVDLTTTTSRLGSTFGSPAYLGAALCLLLPVAAGTATDRGEATSWRTGGAIALGAGLFLLAGSGTRAALVGLAPALLLTVGLWWPKLRRRPLPTGAVAVGLVLLAVTVPQAGRLFDPAVEGRVAEWRTAVSALSAHPLTGTGLEGYRVVFPRHVDVEYVQRYGRSTVTDRAHSGPLDLGVATGAFGLVAWVVAGGWLIWRAARVVRPGDPVLTGMAAAVVAVLVQQLFLFPTLEVGVAAWMVAGAVVAARPGAAPIRSRGLAAGALLMAIAAFVVGGADVVADHRAASARERGSAAAAAAAGEVRPDSFRYPLLAADLALRAGRPGLASLHLSEALALSPRDPALRLARARVVASLVREGSVSARDGAEEVGRLVATDPHHPRLRLIHGDLLARAGEPGEAERAYLAAAHLQPRHAEAQLRLASLYLAVGDRRLAQEALAEARRRQPDHPGIARLSREMEDA